jgi:hypothetical protein
VIPGFRFLSKLVLLAVILGALFVGANQWVKAQGEKRIAQAIDKNFGVKDAQVTIDDFPVLVHIFSGKLAALSIKADDVTVHGLQLHTLRVRLDDLRVTGGIIGGGRLSVKVGHGTLSTQITQAGIDAYLAAHKQNATIELHEDSAVLHARRMIAGRMRTLDATGTLVLLRSSQVLRFQPASVRVDGHVPPPPLEAEAKRRATIDVSIPKLPGGIKAESVQVHEGIATVTADFDDKTLSLTG